MPIKMLRITLNQFMLYMLYIIILHGFHLIDRGPSHMQNDKWWDNLWNQFFTYLRWGLQPLINQVDKWIESIRLQPRTDKYYSPHRRIYYSTRMTRTLVYTAIIAMTTRQNYNVSEAIPFDMDSQMIGIDNRCSACITHVRTDMPGELTPCHRSIKGFGGAKIWEVWRGTIKWCIEDDTGVKHTHIIPNSYYVPQAKVRLLSPQHWAQARTGVDKNGGAGTLTTATTCTLFWDNKSACRTIPIDIKGNNVATFYMATGYQRFHEYCLNMNIENYESDPLTQMEVDVSLISNDEESDQDEDQLTDMDTDDEMRFSQESEHMEKDPEPRSFNLDGPTTTDVAQRPTIITDEEDRITETPTAELLRYHYDMGHNSFAKLQQMAKQRVLPHHLSSCAIPVCSACQYAKATRRPWRAKTTSSHDRSTPSKPGEVISVDQFVSPVPGLIAQMTGFITKQRYKYATVYIDQYSGFGFVYLQRTASAQETLQSKQAMERYAQARNIIIKAYHADNGIFKAKEWVQACHDAREQLTFAAVGANHANGKAERRIRELQELARTQLIHANRRWPKAITSNLWPYALRHANDCVNNTPNLQSGSKLTPQQLFTSTTVMINKKHWKPFGCPVFVLDEQLQSGRPYQKWRQRTHVSIYLGQSPIHNRNVALVLHRNTGHVSRQFHVKFDPSFHTVKQDNLECTWQQATYFVQPPPTKQPSKQSKQLKTTPQMQHEQLSHSEAVKTAHHPLMNRVQSKERMNPPQQQKPIEPIITTEK